jgi:hypothetical protein
MGHSPVKVASIDGSTQITVDGLLQMTLLADGSALIDIAGNRTEVERKGLQYTVRPAQTITTPGGYIYEEPEVTGQPDVSISLPFDEAYDVLLDGITNEATIEPITEPTFKQLAYELLHLLIDASNEADESRSADAE